MTPTKPPRPASLDFALSFLGDPEAQELAAYVSALEAAIDAATRQGTMKLWLLLPAADLPAGDNPWDPWFNKAMGFVVRAETEAAARAMAHNQAEDENRGVFLGGKIADTNQPWLDAKYSSCVELAPDGAAGVVMKDFKAA